MRGHGVSPHRRGFHLRAQLHRRTHRDGNRHCLRHGRVDSVQPSRGRDLGTFSSAIAASIAKGETVEDAVSLAKAYITGAIANAFPIGSGHGPLNHFHEWWDHQAANPFKIIGTSVPVPLYLLDSVPSAILPQPMGFCPRFRAIGQEVSVGNTTKGRSCLEGRR